MMRKALAALALAGLGALGGWLIHQRSAETPKADEAAVELTTPLAGEAEPVAPPSEIAAPSLRLQTVEIGRRDTLVAALVRNEVPSLTAH